MIEDPKPDNETDKIRQGETRGMSKLLVISLLGAALLLLVALLFFAY